MVAIDFTMEGGVVLRVETENEEELIGSAAKVVDADGNESQAPEGDHILEDGRIVSVNAEGMITEIKVEESSEEGEPDEELAKVKKELEEAQAKLKEFEEGIDQKVEELVSAKLKEVDQAVEELEKGAEELASDKAQLKAMKTIYKIEKDRDFIKELDERNTPSSFEEAKAKRDERRGEKKKAKRGAIVGKIGQLNQ